MNRHRHRIIVEGMDATGKTTLIQQLLVDFPTLYVIPGMGPDADYERDIPIMLDEEENGQDPIHDRFFFSELIYGPILRGKLNMGDGLIQNTAWFLRNTAFLIYARPHSKVIGANLFNTGPAQMEGVIEHGEDILKGYDQFMAIEKSWFGTRFFQYDYNTPTSYSELSKLLTGYLRT